MSLKHVIVGTAGHIDHGKTTLIKALTGVDTDRLKEEKKRGISIELGFAEFKLPSGQVAGVVDVPGHERFVKNMLAGATGIDLLLLVVAADDGVMPQTKEHLAIADLLGVKRAVVALTKADLVEEEWLEIVQDDVRSVLKGTLFEGAPIVPVSPLAGFGLEKLVAEIDEAVREVLPKDTDAPYRLPIDRIFTLKGVGTVVTGTLWSGEISPEMQVRILPRDLSARVRSVQIHGHRVEKASAGQRVALNLVGVGSGEIERGDVVLPLGYLSLSRMFDAKLHLLSDASKPLKSGVRVRVHHGTQEAMGRIILLDAQEIPPGESTYVQIRLEKPMVPKFDDKFIIRSYSPIHTIGGGRILDSCPLKHRRFSPGTLERMKILEKGYPAEMVELIFVGAKFHPLDKKAIVDRSGLSEEVVEEALATLVRDGAVRSLGGGGFFISAAGYDEIKSDVVAFLERYHVESPLSTGAKKEMVRAKVLPSLSPGLADIIFADLLASGTVSQEGDALRHPLVATEPSPAHREMCDKIEKLLFEQRFTPPLLNEVSELLGITQEEAREYLRMLLSQGEVVRVRHDLYFHGAIFEEIKDKVVSFLGEREKIGPGEFKDLLGVSRKYALPLLEYLDAQRITRRVGNDRVLR